MNQRKFKAKLPRDTAQGIHDIIETIITQSTESNDNEKLLLAALYEVKQKIYGKLGTYQKFYRIALSPVQAMAVRLLFSEYCHEADNTPTSYLGNQLHQLANSIHQWSA